MTSDACRSWVLDELHPRGPRCPDCDTLVTSERTLASFRAGRRCRCHCGRWFTATTGTILEGANISIEQVLLLAILNDIINTGLDINRVAQLVGVSTNTVRIWFLRFRALNDD